MKAARRSKGFRAATDLVAARVRAATEARGFSQTRLLTHWAEIAGQEVAAIARPIDVKYGRGNFGATLTLLTTGAHAPILKMQEPQIRERVNACYGYNAITKIRITQTAPTGFAAGQIDFATAPTPKPRPDPEAVAQAKSQAAEVQDEGLRAALERLGANIISKSKTN